MSLSSVRDLFRTRLDGLGYREHKDGFNFENIPQTLLDESYHLEIATITGSTTNQLTTFFEYPLNVRIFLKGFRDPASAIDDAITRAEEILADILSPSVRYGDDVKDIVPNTIEVNPLAITNDNDVILEMTFTSRIFCNFT